MSVTRVPGSYYIQLAPYLIAKRLFRPRGMCEQKLLRVQQRVLFGLQGFILGILSCLEIGVKGHAAAVFVTKDGVLMNPENVVCGEVFMLDGVKHSYQFWVPFKTLRCTPSF